ncbi:MAG: diguanylate cyclase [Gammaproteobacteria bacterium]|nr:diguanylate cyclase [Gammaproteobacteria bacterium]
MDIQLYEFWQNSAAGGQYDLLAIAFAVGATLSLFWRSLPTASGLYAFGRFFWLKNHHHWALPKRSTHTLDYIASLREMGWQTVETAKGRLQHPMQRASLWYFGAGWFGVTVVRQVSADAKPQQRDDKCQSLADLRQLVGLRAGTRHRVVMLCLWFSVSERVDVEEILHARIQRNIKHRDRYSLAESGEFWVVLDRFAEADLATDRLFRLSQRLSAPYIYDGRQYPLKITVGIAIGRDDFAHFDQLSAAAMVAMTVAKTSGRVACIYTAPLLEKYRAQLALRQQLRLIKQLPLELRYVPAKQTLVEGALAFEVIPLVVIEGLEVPWREVTGSLSAAQITAGFCAIADTLARHVAYLNAAEPRVYVLGMVLSFSSRYSEQVNFTLPMGSTKFWSLGSANPQGACAIGTTIWHHGVDIRQAQVAELISELDCLAQPSWGDAACCLVGQLESADCDTHMPENVVWNSIYSQAAQRLTIEEIRQFEHQSIRLPIT